MVLIIFCGTAAGSEEKLQQTDIPKQWINIIAPAENEEIVGKRPEVKAEFTEPVEPNTLVVILDGIDITALLTLTGRGFDYRPFLVLPAGPHQLSISAADKEGRQLGKTISFSSRHSNAFEQAYMSNEASVVYETVLAEPDAASAVPDSKVEGNLRSDTRVKGKEWDFTFSTNLRFLDQNAPVLLPQKKGIDAANWIFTGTYSKENFRFRTNIGDIQVNETPNTVFNLARKGGIFIFESDAYQLNVFSLQSAQVFGLKGGTGIEGTVDGHILGVSGGLKLLDKKVEFRTIYVTGQESGNSFGISTIPGARKGDVTGFVMTSDFFENKLRTEFELDLSKFDPDISDEFKARSDKAYRLRAQGVLGMYNYEVLYEYIGRDYAVVGSQMIQKDKEGVSARGGAGLGVHAINLMLSRYNDNVRGDELFPRIVNYQGVLDYSFFGVPNLPVGAGYQKSLQDSTREPSGTSPVNLDTDTILGRIGYMIDKFNFGFQTSYSLMNDKTAANNDTTAITYTFTPAYNAPALMINPSFSINQTKSRITEVRTDTYTMNLDLRTRLFRDSAFFDLGGTYNIIRADNGSVNTRNLVANFRLAYKIKKFLKGYLRPTIGLRGTYLRITDKINPGSDRDEFTLFLVLATTMPFSF
jgi:hypothetical protein